MLGYHAALAIHPGSSYGVVVLLGGHYPDAAKLAYDAFEVFQPAIDKVLTEASIDIFAGKWGRDGNNSASIQISKGTLYIDSLVINDTDILPMFGVRSRVALRPTQVINDQHDFRYT